MKNRVKYISYSELLMGWQLFHKEKFEDHDSISMKPTRTWRFDEIDK